MGPGHERSAHDHAEHDVAHELAVEPARGDAPVAGRPTSIAVRPLVLAVDDDPVQRHLLRSVLQRAGFDVALAVDGEQAITLAIQLRPDVIVTDAIMPKASGFDLITGLQSRLGNVRVPTIVVSGTADIGTRLEAFECGADDFVAKPFEPAELVARINAQLRIAGHWTAQANAMLAEIRTTRQGVTEQRADGDGDGPATSNATRLDAARSLFDARPAALGCATLAVVDERGRIDWVPRPAVAAWSLIEPATIGLDRSHPTVDLELGQADRCPLCGAAGEGRLTITAAGRWRESRGEGTAYLMIGCQSPARQPHRVLAQQLADAIDRVVSDRPDHQFADASAREWIDSVIHDRAYRFVFQPIVTLGSGRVVGYEALARFADGLDTIEVLEAASRAGRRVTLELALVRGALNAASVFPDGTWIHINVSPLAALAPELGELVDDGRSHVVLEITEDALFDADGATHLRASLPPNCRLAIDDVGAGYAGLSRLLDVRPDIVKIDRAVIAGIHLDPARQALVAGLVQFGLVTDSMVIAEGIEVEEERVVLNRLGVRFAQGYLFARPDTPLVASMLTELHPRLGTGEPRTDPYQR